MSCNGCRVLRKGCSPDCVIRPCLEWIKSPESQANATIFLAKFYGRVGLINLINTGPNHLRPDIFRSLLYDACGRIINPIHGSVGLLWTGNWRECQSAVDSVLKGSATFITNTALDSMKPYDHHKVQTRSHFERTPNTPEATLVWLCPTDDIRCHVGAVGRGLHEAKSVSLGPTPIGHQSCGGFNGAAKLELTLGVSETSPVVDPSAAEADQK